MTPPEQELENLTEELERLKSEQDKAMSLAVYVGVTKEEAKRHNERRTAPRFFCIKHVAKFF